MPFSYLNSVFSNLEPGDYRLRYTFSEEYYNFSPTSKEIGINGAKVEVETEHREATETEPAALIVTTGTIHVSAVEYDEEAAKKLDYNQLNDKKHQDYDQRATGYKLGIAQGVTFEGVAYRDDILADGTMEADENINSLLDSQGTGPR